MLQACTAIRPEPVEKAYLLHLEKSSTQEEYVRGHMTQNPYSSAQVGPLMRDVKNHICRQLDLTGEPALFLKDAWLMLPCCTSASTFWAKCQLCEAGRCSASPTPSAYF